MSIVPGIDGYKAEEFFVQQEPSFSNIDKLIDEFHCQYGDPPQTMIVSSYDCEVLEQEACKAGRHSYQASILRYRGIEVQVQSTFARGTIELKRDYPMEEQVFHIKGVMTINEARKQVSLPPPNPDYFEIQ